MPARRGRGSAAAARGRQSQTTPATTTEEKPNTEEPSTTDADAQSMEVEETDGNPAGEEGGEQDVAEEAGAGDVEVEVDPQNDSIADEEQSANDGNKSDLARQDSGRNQVVWQLRVCPILFEDFCKLKKDFVSVIKLSCFFEYRMSQHLASSLEVSTWTHTMEDKDVPWLPKEKIFTKPQNAATAGMLEIKVVDANLVELMKALRTANLSKRNRLRFELKRLGRKETKQGEAKPEGEAETDGEAKTEGEAKAEEETKADGDEEMKEEKTEKGDGKSAANQSFQEESSDMLINFAVRLKPVKMPAFSHGQGYELQPEDKQIFLTKVPEDVPDNVLQAILMADLLERRKADVGSGTVVFHVSSPWGAQGYMELFDGILVNSKDIEMATTLGTLYDAKKKHSDKEQENRQANEKQMKGVKRKSEHPLADEQDAKRPREERLDPMAQIWMKSITVSKDAQGALMVGKVAVQHRRAAQRATGPDRGGLTPRGASLGPRGRALARAGLRGRGARGAVTPGGRGVAAARGVSRGGRGVLARGVMMGAPRGGRGVLGRAPRGGRGVLGRAAGAGRGVLGRAPGDGRGVLGRAPGDGREALGRGAVKSKVFVRGGTRGLSPRGGRGAPSGVPPRRDAYSPRAGGGYQAMEDLQAKLLATERELELLQEARMADYHAMEREARYHDDRYSPRRGYDPGMEYYDEGFDRDLSSLHRRRW